MKKLDVVAHTCDPGMPIVNGRMYIHVIVYVIPFCFLCICLIEKLEGIVRWLSG